MDRGKKPLRDATLVIIATEGSLTESLYFNTFQSSRVQLKVIPSSGGRSAPQHVLENLREYKRDFQLGSGDELWLVGDVDAWPKANLSEVATNCIKEEVRLGFSNPCFEFWLCLHTDAQLPDVIYAKSLIKHLKAYLGSFSKSRYEVDKLKLGLKNAVSRAKVLDKNPKDRWPQDPGSHVYKLIAKILKKTN